MPLPAALAARLARRGLITKEETEQKKQDAVEEEVFAEDYDEPDSGNAAPASGQEVESGLHDMAEEEAGEMDTNASDEILIHDTLDCPNLDNPFHSCSDYCKKRWGFKKFQSDAVTDRKRLRMLKKYPLPEGWEEVADPHTGRYYYWNIYTGQVSWMSPLHPRAQIAMPAEKPRGAASGLNAAGRRGSLSDSDVSEDEEGEEEEEEEGVALAPEGMEVDDNHDFEELERELLMEKKGINRKDKRVTGVQFASDQRRKKEPLDPMDPASYSEVPRGTWSTGLDRRGSAKTGVDATASGPLFQQRPYPSPGSILRMNKSLEPDKS